MLEVDLASSEARLGYRLAWSGDGAQARRVSADTSGDGVVSAVEANRALDRATLELLGALRVCTGRTASEVRCRALDRRNVLTAEAEGWVATPGGHLHLAWSLGLAVQPGAVGALRVEDHGQDPHVEVTEVRFLGPAHTPLLRAGEGTAPTGVTREFAWLERRRTPGPRVLSAEWAPPPPAPVAWRIAASLALGGLAGTAAWWFLKGRRAARASSAPPPRSTDAGGRGRGAG